MQILQILFLTWNIGHPSAIPQLSTAFDKFKQNYSDLIFICLQEIDKRSHIFNGHCEKAMNIYTSQIVNEFPNYSLFYKFNFQSVALFILANKQTKYQNIIQKLTKVIKHDADGKGSIISTLLINNKTISVIGNHLQYDARNFDERNIEWLNVIHNYLFKSDFIIMLGDLNYRIELNFDKILKKISQRNYNRLLRADQLKKAQRIFPLLGLFKEPLINFPPTYKFEKNSTNYDASSIKRVPSYTDRILVATFRNNNFPKVKEYNCISTQVSDHRPVYAFYDFFL
ncbi:hypothetical protein M9Y10_003820 [Tritrichomonas musculus]|uniref:Inositol polyphosphate-related phosphatase domain-containing protein n=1 Tax=Tritrichomonas musculus TaxID=1915356 RepID=A0ABR2JQC4_9EUKA